MWMMLFMILGLSLLFFPLIGFFFPILFIALPLLFMFSKPSVKVYTRTFTPEDFNGSTKHSNSSEPTKSLPNVIDVDYTEREI